MKHRHGLVTDCHHLPMVPIVPQSAPMASVADVSVKLYFSGAKEAYNYFSDAGKVHINTSQASPAPERYQISIYI